MRYVVVGRGRVGTALANALPGSLHLPGRGFEGLPNLGSVDVVLLGVPDAVLPELAARIVDSPATVLHCAGAVPCSALGAGSKGVFYPMVSFREPVNWSEVPVFAEAQNDQARAAICALAVDLGCPEPRWTNSTERARYHLGAVFANNFSNHVVALLQDYCRAANLDPKTYESMIRATVEAALNGDARALQTGPAARGDRPTVERHLELLPEELRAVYRALSESIQRTAS